MSGFTLYGRDQAIKSVFIPEDYSLPNQLYLALTVSGVSESDTGDTLDEPADAAYARQPYDLGALWWGTGGDGVVVNLQEVEFGPADVDWGLMTGWALCTGLTGGEVVVAGDVANPPKVVAGPQSTVRMGAGQLVVVFV